MTTVTVLGCGPAGLVAAQAAADAGFDVMVMSKKRRSHLWGCQYLHAPVPGVTPLESTMVRYRLDGSTDGYAAKVYGPEYHGPVSPDEFESQHQAWDLRTTYERLWHAWGPSVIDVPFVNGNMAADVMPDLLRTGPVFSTIPRPVLCNARAHNFHSAEVWAIGDSEEQRSPIYPPEDNMVLCNGDPDVGWYRTAKVFGYTTCEWPWRDGKRPPYENVAMVSKPLFTDCTCLPEVTYLGRYGKWQKGYLVHHVYEDVTAKLQAGVQEGLW
jgi:hypothetical protein